VIRTLQIDNFRCFRSLTLPDLRRFTILVGKNGSGKTALLESLFVAAGGSAEIYIRTNAWRGRDIIGVKIDSALSLFEDFFYQFDPAKGLRISFKDSYNEEREVRVGVRPSETISLPFESKVSEAMRSRDFKFTWKTPNGEIDSVLEVTRDGLRVAQPGDVFPMVFLNSLTVGSTNDVADKWSAISARNMEEPVIEAVRGLFPEVLGVSVLSLGGIPTVHVSVKGLERKIPAGLLSAGVNKFISILVAIGYARKGVVLIDEIENGLYHKIDGDMWHAISVFAVDNNSQIFATTHSNEFLEAVAPFAEKDDKNYSLLRMERRDGDIQVETFGGKEFGGAVRSGFEIR